MNFRLITLEAFTDNYIYILENAMKKTIVIDPGDTDVICNFLESQKMQVNHILVTHHHADHIGGIGTLFAEHHCKVIAPFHESRKIPDITRLAKDGDNFTLENFKIHAIETPGHTKGHICYYIPQIKILFAGDTLFGFGCGRLLEGTPAQAFHSLLKLRELPDDTNVYCGHEYTMQNIDFTRDFSKEIGFTLPDIFETRVARMQELRDDGNPTMPLNLGEEKQTNLFLMADNPELIKLLNVPNAVEAFTKIRLARNKF
ncbi:MAG: hydroxyacylglutathione hydrolase [Alphaproteobacteria bacterium]|nr:hydroxyacylglutathione hydrolase [Alphaproteobacteria bacterium]